MRVGKLGPSWVKCQNPEIGFQFILTVLFGVSQPFIHGILSCVYCNYEAWYADGRGFDPHVRQHSFVEFCHKIISTANLSLPLIQEGQLSVTGEGMCTKYW